MSAPKSQEQMTDDYSSEQLFHGKFIPNESHPLPLGRRICVGIAVGLAIFVMAAMSLNVLSSWGVWVPLLIISVFTSTTLVLWIRDAHLHPATAVDGTE
jgi:hypothetical protein